ncbi:helix-turn-helix domain-containing protein [Methylorubrum suomiense]|uniref:HTH-type transcriptional activator RhaS n=1 Tax=Methylorubrum suomiense TaxID=144191 RepID=A0ABQ4UZW4_9HYPH|nr:helix-turn-helix domain-containing protein [Methylorubrum suomiense]GJE77881.1 HTH-type transcriptional activator RhaS [Methylorubrum suomiense]
MTALPFLTLDTRLLPPAQRLAAWRAAIPNYDAHPIEGAEAAFGVFARAWLLGDIIVTHTTVSAVCFSRSTERLRADGADTYNLHILLQGSGSGDVDGRALSVGPGQLVGFDLSRPFTVLSEPSESVSIVIGRATLQDAARAEPDLHGHVFEGAAGLLLADHCLALTRHLPAATTNDAAPIVRATLAHVVAALPAARSRPTTGEAGATRIRHEVRRYIDRHIGSDDLSPETIGQSLDLSRTSLYRSFQPVGGIAAFILRRRLQAVRTLLLHPSETRPISDIARSLGFTSNSHFAAAFRKEYGCSPRDVRAHQRIPIDPGETHGDVSSQFQSWMVR